MNINEYKFLIESNEDARSRVEAVFRSSNEAEDRADDLASMGIVSYDLANIMSDMDFDDYDNPRYRDEIALFNYLWEKYNGNQ